MVEEEWDETEGLELKSQLISHQEYAFRQAILILQILVFISIKLELYHISSVLEKW